MSEICVVPAEGGDQELTVLREPPKGSDPPTVLYLHGFGSYQEGEKANYFRERIGRAGFGFVSLDFQGHGRSGGSITGLTLSRCLRDIDRVCRSVSGLDDQVAILGSSMGALAGAWHAAFRPEAVRALVLISPAIGLDTTMAELLGTEGMAEWQRAGVLEITNELGTFELGWEFVTDLEEYSGADLAAILKVPTLIFQGKLDDRVSWREVAKLAAATPDSTRLELLEAGDHRLIEHMDWIATEAVSFLGGAT